MQNTNVDLVTILMQKVAVIERRFPVDHRADRSYDKLTTDFDNSLKALLQKQWKLSNKQIERVEKLLDSYFDDGLYEVIDVVSKDPADIFHQANINVLVGLKVTWMNILTGKYPASQNATRKIYQRITCKNYDPET